MLQTSPQRMTPLSGKYFKYNIHKSNASELWPLNTWWKQWLYFLIFAHSWFDGGSKVKKMVIAFNVIMYIKPSTPCFINSFFGPTQNRGMKKSSNSISLIATCSDKLYRSSCPTSGRDTPGFTAIPTLYVKKLLIK